MLIASGTENVWRVSLKLELFLAASRFHCHRSMISIYFGNVEPAAMLALLMSGGPLRKCRRCSARGGQDSARHETQCSTGYVTQPLYPWREAGLKRSGSRDPDLRQTCCQHLTILMTSRADCPSILRTSTIYS